MVVIARVRAYTPDGITLLGVLPTIGLRFSVEVGGGGGCAFTALTTDLDSLGAWDSVLHVELETGPGVWTAVAGYALRPPYRYDRAGFVQVDCEAISLLEQWASETIVFPEYGRSKIPRGAGTDRGLGWMGTVYDPASDPAEAWDGCNNTARTTFPTDWPTASNAKWISVAGFTDKSERKLFRSEMTVAGTGPQLLRVWLSSDESATLYVGADPVIETSSVETGYEEFTDVYMVVYPGTYALAVDTQTVTGHQGGGDGVDPIAVAVALLDSDGAVDSWLNVSTATGDAWRACRRDDQPPDNQPPGPTPGKMIRDLVGEAADRNAAGWAETMFGFTATADSYSVAWPDPVVERLVRVGSDTYAAIFAMLAETGEVDVWMGPDLVVHAAPEQGEDLTGTIVLDTSNTATATRTTAPVAGSFIAALALDGWINAQQAGMPRREYGMELGTAMSRAIAERVVDAAVREASRVDMTCRLAPTAPTPLVDFQPGDTISLSYPGLPSAARVLSMSAEAGDGGLLWDLELVVLP